MKKSYITPEFELIDISTAEFLAGSTTEPSAGDGWEQGGDGNDFENDDEW